MVGAKLNIPQIEDPRISESEKEEIFDYDDDADVTSTLKSAHQAELIYGMHKSQSNRGYGYGGGYNGNNKPGEWKPNPAW